MSRAAPVMFVAAIAQALADAEHEVNIDTFIAEHGEEILAFVSAQGHNRPNTLSCKAYSKCIKNSSNEQLIDEFFSDTKNAGKIDRDNFIRDITTVVNNIISDEANDNDNDNEDDFEEEDAVTIGDKPTVDNKPSKKEVKVVTLDDEDDEDDEPMSTFQPDGGIADSNFDFEPYSPQVTDRVAAGNKAPAKASKSTKATKAKQPAKTFTFAAKGDPFSLQTDELDISVIKGKTFNDISELEQLAKDVDVSFKPDIIAFRAAIIKSLDAHNAKLSKAPRKKDDAKQADMSPITVAEVDKYINIYNKVTTLYHSIVNENSVYTSLTFVASKDGGKLTVKQHSSDNSNKVETYQLVDTLSNSKAKVKVAEKLVAECGDSALVEYLNLYREFVALHSKISKVKLLPHLYFSIPSVIYGDSCGAFDVKSLPGAEGELYKAFGISRQGVSKTIAKQCRSPMNYYEHALMTNLHNFTKTISASMLEGVFENRYAFLTSSVKERLVNACLRAELNIRKYKPAKADKEEEDAIAAWRKILISPCIIKILCDIDITNGPHEFNSAFSTAFKSLYTSRASMKLFTHALYPISCLFTPFMIGALTDASHTYSLKKVFDEIVKKKKTMASYAMYINEIFNIESSFKIAPRDLWVYYLDSKAIGESAPQLTYTIFYERMVKEEKEETTADGTKEDE